MAEQLSPEVQKAEDKMKAMLAAISEAESNAQAALHARAAELVREFAEERIRGARASAQDSEDELKAAVQSDRDLAKSDTQSTVALPDEAAAKRDAEFAEDDKEAAKEDAKSAKADAKDAQEAAKAADKAASAKDADPSTFDAAADAKFASFTADARAAHTAADAKAANKADAKSA